MLEEVTEGFQLAEEVVSNIVRAVYAAKDPDEALVSGNEKAEIEQLRNQLMLIRELVYGPPRKSAPDSWQALRNILEQTEPTPPRLVLNIRDAVRKSASPIEQAGRVRWLLQQEKLL